MLTKLNVWYFSKSFKIQNGMVFEDFHFDQCLQGDIFFAKCSYRQLSVKLDRTID